MIIKLCTSFLFVNMIGIISPLSVNIDIQPKIIKPGEMLLVTCQISFDPVDKGFQTLLKCPFNNKGTVCISNCDSMDLCTSTFCNSKMVGNQSFQCDLKDSFNSVTYQYRFPSISSLLLRNRNHLQFTCTFKGSDAIGYVNVSANVPGPTKATELTASTSLATTFSTGNHNYGPDFFTGILKLRDFILIGLLGGLFVSFLINIWCSVQWCIRKVRNKKVKKQRKFESSLKHYYPGEETRNLNRNNFSHNSYSDDVKISRSDQTLINSERNTPTRYNSNVAIPSNTGSINYRTKPKGSFLSVDDYNNTGSNQSLRTSMYGPMVLTPIQYLDPSVLSYINQIQPFQQNVLVNMENNKSQNNLDDISEQDISDKQTNLIFPPLPRRPDELLSDKDSVFS